MLAGLFRRRHVPLVGVDVGTRTIAVVQAGAGFKVEGVAEVETPPGAVHEGQVLDARLLGAAIREALRTAKVTARSAVLAVPAQYGFLRQVTFPPMPLKELRATVDLQPERYIPLSREGSVYDVQILPGLNGDGQMTAVLAAAPRRQVGDLMAASREAGLRPVRVDLEPLALHRALMAAGEAQREATVVLVDLGATGAKISLFAGDLPLITRVVEMSGTEDLFVDIRRSLEFAITQSGAHPSRVFVGGGGGTDAYMLIALTGYLRSFLAGRLPADFQVEPLRGGALGLEPSQMLAFGLSVAPEMLS